MADSDGIEEAQASFQRGYEAQMAGRLDEAIEHYRRSIEIHPTAEAHTFLGWTYSFQGRHEAAIAECHVAISVDPDFGNPYNDIGVYLIELGRYEEAIPWLERAKRARRYEPRHFPYANLARVYVKQNRLIEAMTELRSALRIAPDYEIARRELQRIAHRLHSLN
jgi:tetratricopeptide (TPR) repeat protein